MQFPSAPPIFIILAMNLSKTDPQIYTLIQKEEKRQKDCLNLIPSENYTSLVVREALGSVLTNKYSEGYPGRRYYAGNKYIDQIEQLAISRAKELFGAEHVNVQPYSGSPANLAIYFALLKPGDKILSMSLQAGGHLTHGAPVNLSGQLFQFIFYGVEPATGLIDYDEVERLAQKEKPKMIVCGATSYPRVLNFQRFAQIAHHIGAYCLADISHVAGLVAAGLHPSPFPFADVVMTTTHKTLRGPRGAIIMSKKSLSDKIDKMVFPGLQGGPHDYQTAAIAVALKEAQTPEFRIYVGQLVKNCRVLAEELKKEGLTLVSNGTDNHLLLIDLRNLKITGNEAQDLLERANIIVNKNVIPGEPRKPWDPSGLRLGTPAITTRGMKEREMVQIAQMIARVLRQKDEKTIQKVKKAIKTLTQNFPFPK